MKSEEIDKMKQNNPIQPSGQYAGKPIYEVPFIPELFDKICPSSIIGKLKAIRQYPFERMVDLLDVDYERFREMGGGGVGKWVLFQDFRQKMTDPDMQDRIIDIYQCCFVAHTYPEITPEEAKDLTLSERFDLAVRQYIHGVERIAEYNSAVTDNLTKIKTLFCTRHSRVEKAEMLGISRERIRQLLMTLPKHLLEGTLPGAGNLRISPSLADEVMSLAGTLSKVSSAHTLCQLYQCKDFDNTMLGNFLPLQRVPQRSVPVGVSDYRSFDQIYYVDAENDSKWLKTYINTLTGVLGNHAEIYEIRPVDMDSIMSLMAQVKPKFQFDREVVQALLSQHQWFEEVNADGVVKYQMKYHFLQSAYKALARMVYEEKSVSLSEIDNIHRTRINNPQAPSILNLVSVAKKRIPWIISSGQNGKIEYSETGENRTRLIDVVRTWTKQRVLFTLDELTTHLTGLGYTDVAGQTLRAYVSAICYVENKRSDLFCHAEHIHEYTEGYSWRKKPRSGLMNWIARNIHSYLMEMPNHTLSLKDVQDRMYDDAVEVQSRFKFNYSIQICLQRYLVKEGWVKVKGEALLLTTRGCKAQPHELERIGTRTRKSELYDAVKDKAISMLKASPDGEIPMTDLLAECRDMIGNRADTIIYKIVDGYMTDDVTTVKRGRRVFLKLIEQ